MAAQLGRKPAASSQQPAASSQARRPPPAVGRFPLLLFCFVPLLRQCAALPAQGRASGATLFWLSRKPIDHQIYLSPRRILLMRDIALLFLVARCLSARPRDRSCEGIEV